MGRRHKRLKQQSPARGFTSTPSGLINKVHFMKIFSKTLTHSDLDFEAKKYMVSEAKAKASSARAGGMLKGLLLSAISLAALALSYNAYKETLRCKGICVADVNAEVVSIGFDAVEADKDSQVFVVEYAGAYLESSSTTFRNKLLKVKTMAREGDRLVVNIKSNGGDAIACSNDYAIINELESSYGVETVTVVDRAAHSCGYYLASASTTIYAQQGASLGNIGSAMQLPSNVIDGALRKLTGEGLVVVGSTRAKELFAGAPVKSQADLDILKKYVDDNAAYFFNDVIEGRGDRIAEDDYEEVFSAYPFTARKALKLGLIDGLSSMEEVVLEYHQQGYNIKRIEWIGEQQSTTRIGLGSVLKALRVI